MNVSLMSFSKKKNSTATPSSGGSTKTGTLRTGCSVLNPVIGFELSRITFANWNYAYISDFYRYYYIQDWKWEGGLWWAYMEVDPLASFKVGIGASSCYVLRAASEYDGFISDSLYPTKCIKLATKTQLESPWTATTFSNGIYIVGVIGRGSSAGAVNYYALSPSDMNSLREFLMSDSTYLGTMEITSELAKALFNPFQYIVSAMWFPLTASDIPIGAQGNIALGWWNTSVSAAKVIIFHNTLHKTFNLSASPYAVSIGRQYLASTPFSRYYVYYPPFGEIELDGQIVSSFILGGENETFSTIEITADIKIDYITGQSYLRLSCSGIELAYREAQIGVPCQLGQITADIGKGITTFARESDFSSISMITNPAGTVITNLAATYDGIAAAAPRALISGNQCGESVASLDPVLTVIFNRPVDDSREENGRPLCKTKTISSLSGYIKTMNSDIVIAGATDAEQEQIRAMMNGGFFYE